MEGTRTHEGSSLTENLSKINNIFAETAPVEQGKASWDAVTAISADKSILNLSDVYLPSEKRQAASHEEKCTELSSKFQRMKTVDGKPFSNLTADQLKQLPVGVQNKLDALGLNGVLLNIRGNQDQDLASIANVAFLEYVSTSQDGVPTEELLIQAVQRAHEAVASYNRMRSTPDKPYSKTVEMGVALLKKDGSAVTLQTEGQEIVSLNENGEAMRVGSRGAITIGENQEGKPATIDISGNIYTIPKDQAKGKIIIGGKGTEQKLKAADQAVRKGGLGEVGKYLLRQESEEIGNEDREHIFYRDKVKVLGDSHGKGEHPVDGYFNVCLGDYIDPKFGFIGVHQKGAVLDPDKFRTGMQAWTDTVNRGEGLYIMGNHDVKFLSALLAGPDFAQWWLQDGGDYMCHVFGITLPTEGINKDNYQAFQKSIFEAQDKTLYNFYSMLVNKGKLYSVVNEVYMSHTLPVTTEQGDLAVLTESGKSGVEALDEFESNLRLLAKAQSEGISPDEWKTALMTLDKLFNTNFTLPDGTKNFSPVWTRNEGRDRIVKNPDIADKVFNQLNQQIAKKGSKAQFMLNGHVQEYGNVDKSGRIINIDNAASLTDSHFVTIELKGKSEDSHMTLPSGLSNQPDKEFNYKTNRSRKRSSGKSKSGISNSGAEVTEERSAKKKEEKKTEQKRGSDHPKSGQELLDQFSEGNHHYPYRKELRDDTNSYPLEGIENKLVRGSVNYWEEVGKLMNEVQPLVEGSNVEKQIDILNQLEARVRYTGDYLKVDDAIYDKIQKYVDQDTLLVAIKAKRAKIKLEENTRRQKIRESETGFKDWRRAEYGRRDLRREVYSDAFVKDIGGELIHYFDENKDIRPEQQRDLLGFALFADSFMDIPDPTLGSENGQPRTYRQVFNTLTENPSPENNQLLLEYRRAFYRNTIDALKKISAPLGREPQTPAEKVVWQMQQKGQELAQQLSNAQSEADYQAIVDNYTGASDRTKKRLLTLIYGDNNSTPQMRPVPVGTLVEGSIKGGDLMYRRSLVEAAESAIELYDVPERIYKEKLVEGPIEGEDNKSLREVLKALSNEDDTTSPDDGSGETDPAKITDPGTPDTAPVTTPSTEADDDLPEATVGEDDKNPERPQPAPVGVEDDEEVFVAPEGEDNVVIELKDEEVIGLAAHDLMVEQTNESAHHLHNTDAEKVPLPQDASTWAKFRYYMPHPTRIVRDFYRNLTKDIREKREGKFSLDLRKMMKQQLGVTDHSVTVDLPQDAVDYILKQGQQYKQQERDRRGILYLGGYAMREVVQNSLSNITGLVENTDQSYAKDWLENTAEGQAFFNQYRKRSIDEQTNLGKMFANIGDFDITNPDRLEALNRLTLSNQETRQFVNLAPEQETAIKGLLAAYAQDDTFDDSNPEQLEQRQLQLMSDFNTLMKEGPLQSVDNSNLFLRRELASNIPDLAKRVRAYYKANNEEGLQKLAEMKIRLLAGKAEWGNARNNRDKLGPAPSMQEWFVRRLAERDLSSNGKGYRFGSGGSLSLATSMVKDYGGLIATYGAGYGFGALMVGGRVPRSALTAVGAPVIGAISGLQESGVIFRKGGRIYGIAGTYLHEFNQHSFEMATGRKIADAMPQRREYERSTVDRKSFDELYTNRLQELLNKEALDANEKRELTMRLAEIKARIRLTNLTAAHRRAELGVVQNFIQYDGEKLNEQKMKLNSAILNGFTQIDNTELERAVTMAEAQLRMGATDAQRDQVMTWVRDELAKSGNPPSDAELNNLRTELNKVFTMDSERSLNRAMENLAKLNMRAGIKKAVVVTATAPFIGFIGHTAIEGITTAINESTFITQEYIAEALNRRAAAMGNAHLGWNNIETYRQSAAGIAEGLGNYAESWTHLAGDRHEFLEWEQTPNGSYHLEMNMSPTQQSLVNMTEVMQQTLGIEDAVRETAVLGDGKGVINLPDSYEYFENIKDPSGAEHTFFVDMRTGNVTDMTGMHFEVDETMNQPILVVVDQNGHVQSADSYFKDARISLDHVSDKTVEIPLPDKPLGDPQPLPGQFNQINPETGLPFQVRIPENTQWEILHNAGGKDELALIALDHQGNPMHDANGDFIVLLKNPEFTENGRFVGADYVKLGRSDITIYHNPEEFQTFKTETRTIPGGLTETQNSPEAIAFWEKLGQPLGGQEEYWSNGTQGSDYQELEFYNSVYTKSDGARVVVLDASHMGYASMGNQEMIVKDDLVGKQPLNWVFRLQGHFDQPISLDETMDESDIPGQLHLDPTSTKQVTINGQTMTWGEVSRMMVNWDYLSATNPADGNLATELTNQHEVFNLATTPGGKGLIQVMYRDENNNPNFLAAIRGENFAHGFVQTGEQTITEKVPVDIKYYIPEISLWRDTTIEDIQSTYVFDFKPDSLSVDLPTPWVIPMPMRLAMEKSYKQDEDMSNKNFGPERRRRDGDKLLREGWRASLLGYQIPKSITPQQKTSLEEEKNRLTQEIQELRQRRQQKNPFIRMVTIMGPKARELRYKEKRLDAINKTLQRATVSTQAPANQNPPRTTLALNRTDILHMLNIEENAIAEDNKRRVQTLIDHQQDLAAALQANDEEKIRKQKEEIAKLLKEFNEEQQKEGKKVLSTNPEEKTEELTSAIRVKVDEEQKRKEKKRKAKEKEAKGKRQNETQTGGDESLRITALQSRLNVINRTIETMQQGIESLANETEKQRARSSIENFLRERVKLEDEILGLQANKEGKPPQEIVQQQELNNYLKYKDTMQKDLAEIEDKTFSDKYHMTKEEATKLLGTEEDFIQLYINNLIANYFDSGVYTLAPAEFEPFKKLQQLVSQNQQKFNAFFPQMVAVGNDETARRKLWEKFTEAENIKLSYEEFTKGEAAQQKVLRYTSRTLSGQDDISIARQNLYDKFTSAETQSNLEIDESSESKEKSPIQENILYSKKARIITDTHGGEDVSSSPTTATKKKPLSEFLTNLQPDELIIHNGDVADRGTQSWQAIELMMDKVKKGEAVWNMGNHEMLMMAGIAGDNTAFINWFINGGKETLTSMGLDASAYPDAAKMQEYRNNPKLKELLTFLQQHVKTYTIIDEVLATHAGILVNTDGSLRDLTPKCKEAMTLEANKGKELKGLDALDAIQAEIREGNMRLLSVLLNENDDNNPFWVRDSFQDAIKDYRLAHIIRDQLNSQAQSRGSQVNLMVFGHTPSMGDQVRGTVTFTPAGGRVPRILFADTGYVHTGEPRALKLRVPEDNKKSVVAMYMNPTTGERKGIEHQYELSKQVS